MAQIGRLLTEDRGAAQGLPRADLLPIAYSSLADTPHPVTALDLDEWGTLEILRRSEENAADTAALAWVIAAGLILLQGDNPAATLLDDDSWVTNEFTVWREFYDATRQFWHVCHQSLPAAVNVVRNLSADARDDLKAAEQHRLAAIKLLAAFLARRPPFKLGTQVIQKAAQDWRWLQRALDQAEPSAELRTWLPEFDADAELTRWVRTISPRGERIEGAARRSFMAQVDPIENGTACLGRIGRYGN